MEARDQVTGLLGQLGAELGIELTLTPSGVCILECNDGEECVLIVPEDQNFLVLEMPLLPLFQSDDRAFLEQILRLNLQLDETRGATLGLANAQQVIVCRYLQPLAGLDLQGFAGMLTDFKDTADHLRDVIANQRQSGAVAAMPSPGLGHMLHIAG